MEKGLLCLICHRGYGLLGLINSINELLSIGAGLSSGLKGLGKFHLSPGQFLAAEVQLIELRLIHGHRSASLEFDCHDLLVLVRQT